MQKLKPFAKKYGYAGKETVEELKTFLKQEKDKGKGFSKATGEGFFSDIKDKIGSWAFRNLHPLGRMMSYVQKGRGKGFAPLHNIPPHLIAGSLAHHIKRVRNKRRLMKVHLHNLTC